jgi:hypothetical protein
MKRFALIVMNLLALLLSACGTPPVPPVTENPQLELPDTFDLEIGHIRKPWNWRDYPDTTWVFITNPERTLLTPRPIVAPDDKHSKY